MMFILRHIQNASVKRKIVGSMTLIIVLVGIFIFVFFPTMESENMSRYLRNTATGLATVSANSVAGSLVFLDVDGAKRVLGSMKGVDNLEFAAVIIPDGKIFAGLDEQRGADHLAEAARYFKEQGTFLFEHNGSYVAMAPIVSGSEGRIGTLVLAIDQSQLHSDVAKSRSVSLIICVVVIALGALFGVMVSRIIVTPIKEVVASIDRADLTMQFATERKDEIGDLQQAFGKFVSSIKQTLLQVEEGASAVASASSEISSSTDQMAAGTQEQTSQAGEVASAVEEMTKTIVENSKNASNTAETAKKAKEAAEEGGNVVQETVIGMKRIAEVVNKSAETVKALGKSSDQIGEIISVIDDIADQTNLLALNAAIEAARAGEQGRGFAVVADEVRKLAERTTKATKEIAGMIKAIQTDTAGAVASMEEGTKEVDNGIKLADKAGTSLKEIVGMIQNLTDMVAQIAAASEEQSSASEQISKNVEAISSVTGETASGVQQIARAAEDLNRLTENLQSLVGKFKLSGETLHHVDPRLHSMRAATPVFKTPKAKLAVRVNGALVPHDEEE